MIINCLATYILEVGARVSLKVPTKVFLEVKKLLKLSFLNYCSKAKKEESDQEDWIVSYTFGIDTSCSAKYFLEVGASVSLKLATKASFGKKALKI